MSKTPIEVSSVENEKVEIWEEINPQVKLSLFDTISKQIYSDCGVKIKEAVSNSVDNRATDIIFSLDKETNTLCLFDNGTGISLDRLKEIFSGIGYGDQKNQNKNSYFGLGLFSVLELGQEVLIYTNNEKDGFRCYQFDTGDIFSESNKNLPLSSLKKMIREIKTVKSRQESLISDKDIKDLIPNCKTFTEFVIKNIPHHYMTALSDKSFSDKKLRQLLPLQYDINSSFFKQFTDEAVLDKLQALLDDSNLCKYINFYSRNQDKNNGFVKLYKYYPNFNSDIMFNSGNTVIQHDKNKNYSFYYVFSVNDLESDSGSEMTDSSDTGFWVRNKNFLVKKADFFQKPGTKKMIIQNPLQKWIYCEVFHKNMEPFLVVTRDEYIWGNAEFEALYKELNDFFEKFNKEIRKAQKKVEEIDKALIEPIRAIRNDSKESPLKNLDKRIMELVDDEEQDFNKEKFTKILGSISDKRLENPDLFINKLIENQDSFEIINDKEIKVIISTDKNTHRNYRNTMWDSIAMKPILEISGTLFENAKAKVFGKTYDVHYVYGQENYEPVSINIESSKIFINLFNKATIKYSVTAMDVMIAIEFANKLITDSCSKGCPKVMKEHIYHILGKEDPKFTKHMKSLSNKLGLLTKL